MTITYDEVWITTMREIEICRYSIRKYEDFLERMEAKYGMKTEDFLKKYEGNALEANRDFKKWYDIYLAREKCSLRKKELETFLER